MFWNQWSLTWVRKKSRYSREIYMESAVHLIFSIKLLMRLDIQFNLFIDMIFGRSFDKTYLVIINTIDTIGKLLSCLALLICWSSIARIIKIIWYFLLNCVNCIFDIDLYSSSICTNQNISISILKLFYKKLLFKKFLVEWKYLNNLVSFLIHRLK